MHAMNAKILHIMDSGCDEVFALSWQLLLLNIILQSSKMNSRLRGTIREYKSKSFALCHIVLKIYTFLYITLLCLSLKAYML